MAKVGQNTFIEAASILCIPQDLKLCVSELKKPLNGFYDRMVGGVVNDLVLSHKDILSTYYKDRFNIDLEATVKKLAKNPSLQGFDEMIQCPFWGFSSTDEYYEAASSQRIMHLIKKPTLFLNSMDDPVTSSKALNYDVFAAHDYVLLGVTKYGGHLGYHESAFRFECWFMNPILDFFDAYK